MTKCRLLAGQHVNELGISGKFELRAARSDPATGSNVKLRQQYTMNMNMAVL